MKKILLIPTLLLGTLSIASDFNYEATAVTGYVINESYIGLKNQAVDGAEFQFNNLGTFIAPELSVLYSPAEYENNTKVNMYRIALNGVYEYKNLGFLTPTSKIGFGYETLSSQEIGNLDSPFMDAGFGAKISLADNVALKLEAVYILKHNEARWDSNIAGLAGLNVAFGEVAQKPAPVVAKPVVIAPVKPVAVVAPVKPKPVVVVVDGDDDRDGVKNSLDKCPNTSKSTTSVDAEGCATVVNLEINFETGSAIVQKQSYARVDEFVLFLKESPKYTAKIVGYTDSVGNDKSNLSLSQRRADSVKTMIVSKGIDAKRITTAGLGESNPVATNATKEGRAQNRRIVAELTKN